MNARQKRYSIRYQKYFWNDTEFWIEFPNDADYTAFMLRFG